MIINSVIFKDGWLSDHDEERSGQPSVITKDLVQKDDGKFERTDAFQSDKFPQVSKSVVYGMEIYKAKDSANALTFFEQYRNLVIG